MKVIKRAVYLFLVHMLAMSYYVAGPLLRASSYIYRSYKKMEIPTQAKRVVIVGGGFSGSKIAREMEDYFSEVYLIDTKDFFEFTPSILKTLIYPEYIKNIQVYHKNYLAKTKFFHGKVLSFDNNEKTVNIKPYASDVPTSLAYDYLIICSGSSYHSPSHHPPFKIQNSFNKDDHLIINTTRAETITRCSQRIRSINKILLVGGGTVAIELAGEILSNFPKKEVTIVHSGPDLLHRFPKKASLYAHEFLGKYTVNVLLNDRVTALQFLDDQRAVVYTAKGNELETELVFVCTGIRPNSGFVPPYEDAEVANLNGANEVAQSASVLNHIKVSEPNLHSNQLEQQQSHNTLKDLSGFIKVNEYLQLEGKENENVFVCGDVANTMGEKLAQSAQNSASVVIRNVLSHSRGRTLSAYKSSDLPMVVSLGNIDAIFMWKNFIFTGFLPALIKQVVEFKVMVFYFPPLSRLSSLLRRVK